MPEDPTPTRGMTEERATRVAAGAFLGALLSGLALVVVYFAGGDTQLEGLFLFTAFTGLAVGLGVWARAILNEPEVTEERVPMRSTEEDLAAVQALYEEVVALATPEQRSRRRFLSRLLGGAAASLVLALSLPFLSLGDPPGRSLFSTHWRAGARLVSYDGRPIRPEELETGSVVTVFPLGHVGSGDSQALLIGIDRERLRLPEGAPPTVDGLVCFSKVCTHAGCPVGLYRAEVAELLCPCHQSKFDVTRGATPISGPTTRALPQLPIGLDDEGYLVALDDFPEPVGPAFWNMDRGERT